MNSIWSMSDEEYSDAVKKLGDRVLEMIPPDADLLLVVVPRAAAFEAKFATNLPRDRALEELAALHNSLLPKENK